MGQRPFVLINVAMTVDGKIDTVERRGAPISSESDRDRVQRLRADADAVMVGRRTLLQEDPRLTVRAAELVAERVARGAPPNPAKVSIVHGASDLRADSRFVADGAARVIVFSGDGASDADVAWARGVGVELYPRGAGQVDLAAALETLWALGMRRMLVEGGGTLNFELLRLGLVDEVQVYLAPFVFGGASAPTLADGAGLSRALAIRLMRDGVEALADGGLLLRYKVEQP